MQKVEIKIDEYSLKAIRRKFCFGEFQMNFFLGTFCRLYRKLLLGCFSATARKFIVSDFTFQGPTEGFGPSYHESGHEKLFP